MVARYADRDERKLTEKDRLTCSPSFDKGTAQNLTVESTIVRGLQNVPLGLCWTLSSLGVLQREKRYG